jgi:hypothetical protein
VGAVDGGLKFSLAAYFPLGENPLLTSMSTAAVTPWTPWPEGKVGGKRGYGVIPERLKTALGGFLAVHFHRFSTSVEIVIEGLFRSI